MYSFALYDGVSKALFVKRVYEKLDRKPDYGQYMRDIRLAVLNEYIESVEAEEDEEHWYEWQEVQLANEILNGDQL